MPSNFQCLFANQSKYNSDCDTKYFKCERSSYVPWNKLCDDYSDCCNARDETICTPNLFNKQQIKTYSRHSTFNCNSSATEIDQFLVNDLFPDCLYSEDEYYLLNISQYMFTNTIEQCLGKGLLACVPGYSKCFAIQGLCNYDIDKYGHPMHCRNFAHLVNCEYFQCYQMFKCPEAYCIVNSVVSCSIIV